MFHQDDVCCKHMFVKSGSIHRGCDSWRHRVSKNPSEGAQQIHNERTCSLETAIMKIFIMNGCTFSNRFSTLRHWIRLQSVLGLNGRVRNSYRGQNIFLFFLKKWMLHVLLFFYSIPYLFGMAGIGLTKPNKLCPSPREGSLAQTRPIGPTKSASPVD